MLAFFAQSYYSIAMKSASQLKKFFLLAGDIAVLYLSLYLTLLLRYQTPPNATLWQSHFSLFTAVFAGWLIVFYISNLYDLRLAVNNARFWQLFGKGLLAAALLAVAFFYFLPQNNITPKTNLAIYLAVFAVLFALWRQFYNWSLEAYLPKNYLAIIGFDQQVKELVKELKERASLGYRAAFIIGSASAGQTEFLGTPIESDFSRLAELIREKRITTIVLSSDPHESAELRNSLFACLPLSVNFIRLPLFYENLTGRVPVSDINQMWVLENLSEGGKIFFDLAKRALDFLSAFIFFVATLPFWLIIALIVKLESRGPVFFVHTRLGKNGIPFRLYKFRTMREEGNDRSPTAAQDKRITGFGSFLRKTRIDEIPQVLNIMRGEMSFVGPRPERPELVAELERQIPFYRERMLVKPGVTGSDQVSGEYHSPSYEDTIKKLQYDLFYIKNRSFYLDLSIILKTIYTVLSRGGI